MAKPMKKPAEETTVESAREILALFLDEFSNFFESTKKELEAMKTLVRGA